MPQSLVRNVIHLVFSTKNRELFIGPELRDRLFAYPEESPNTVHIYTISPQGHQ